MSIKLNISERQQVLLIIPAALFALLAIWLFLLRPQYERRREIADLRAQLAKSPYAGRSMEELSQISEREGELAELLDDEWRRTRARLATFAEERDLRENRFGRIDYKLELFKVRAKLNARSDELGVQLIPRNLGMQDALSGSEEEIRTRMLQLRTIEKLVDMTMERRIQRLRAIRPLDPIPHYAADFSAASGASAKAKKTPAKSAAKTTNAKEKEKSAASKGTLLFTEYPVQVDLDVPFEDLYQLFQTVFDENLVFVFRNIRLEAGPTREAPLRIRAVMSSLLFE